MFISRSLRLHLLLLVPPRVFIGFHRLPSLKSHKLVCYALVGVVTNKLDAAFAFENQQHAKYSKCLTTTLRFVGDNTNKGVK
jgi:hypothetical protein